MSKARHLRYEMYDAPPGHPQKVMRDLGITYFHATPQSIADQWWFWCCQGGPVELPPYLRELDIQPSQAIGHGLSSARAAEIEAHMNALEG